MTGRIQNVLAASKKPSSPDRAKSKVPQRQKKHLDELLDEALEETFPASDPPALLEPAPDLPNNSKNRRD